MKGRQAACPACGGTVRFRISSSLVAVCPYCRSVVARGDKRLEDLGKIADLTPTNSPLRLDLRGQYQGKRFRIVGRSQYRHAAGAVWDEWYVAFPGNRWGWLAEAQGRFYLTFQRPTGQTVLPSPRGLAVEQQLTLIDDVLLTVAEVGRAKSVTAEGEIPYRFVADVAHDYADLYGPEGEFATISAEEGATEEEASNAGDGGPTLYLGREVTLDELGLAEASPREVDPAQVSALQVNCPHCAGPLTLQAPDKTERVACPNCHSLLDCRQGRLTYLETLSPPPQAPLIPLGTSAAFQGGQYTLIGFMSRSVTFEEVDYFWTEYLLYDPREGFRWLVHSDQHWSFVRPISAGAVRKSAGTAVFEGRTFKLFQLARATVRHVLGEFYWQVRVGEQVSAADYIAPPQMLSIEKSIPADGQLPTGGGAAQEVSCSLGTYVRREEIEEAFGVQDLPRGFKVAPNQPSPVDKRLFLAWGASAALLVLLDLIFSAGRATRGGVDQSFFWVSLLLMSVVPVATLLYSHSFEKSRWADSEYNPYDTGDDEEE